MMTDLDQKAACAPHTGTELRGLHGQAHGGAGLEHPGHAQRPFFHRERRHRHTGNEVATDGGPAVAGHQVDQEHGGKEGGCQAGGRAGGQKGQAGDQKGQAGGQVVVRLVVRKVRLVVRLWSGWWSERSGWWSGCGQAGGQKGQAAGQACGRWVDLVLALHDAVMIKPND